MVSEKSACLVSHVTHSIELESNQCVSRVLDKNLCPSEKETERKNCFSLSLEVALVCIAFGVTYGEERDGQGVAAIAIRGSLDAVYYRL